MALKKFMFLNTSGGYQEEQGTSDGLKLGSLVVGSGSESSGNINLSSAGKIVNLVDGTDAQDAVTKSQLDAMSAGLSWKDPSQVLKIKSDAAQSGSPPTAGSIGEAWVVDTWGGGYTDGDIVEWDGTQWNVVTAGVSSEPPDNTHAVVISSGAAGSFSGHANKIAVYDADLDSWSFTAASDGWATLVNGEGSVYENTAFVFDTGTGWVQFTGPNSIPDATSASGGGTKGKVTFNSDYGLSVTSGVAKIDIVAAGTGTGGLEFSSGDLQLKVNSTGGLELTSSGIGANVDGTSVGINGSNELYVIGSAEAQRVAYDFTAGTGGITAKYPVYVSANNTILHADAGNDAKVKVIGLAPAAITAAEQGEVIFSGFASGVLSSATAGAAYYLAAGGGLTATLPSAGNHVIRMGMALNADDMCVQIAYLGKRAAA